MRLEAEKAPTQGRRGTKALTGRFKGSYRMRISAPGGEYRLVWEIDDRARKVEVVDAGPREGAY